MISHILVQPQLQMIYRMLSGFCYASDL